MMRKEYIKNYFLNDNKLYFQEKGEVKPKVIKGALSTYARCKEDEILLIRNDSLLGNGKSGMVITEKGIYCSGFSQVYGSDIPTNGFMPFDGIRNVRIEKHFLYITYQDESFYKLYFSIYAQNIYDFLIKWNTYETKETMGDEDDMKKHPIAVENQESEKYVEVLQTNNAEAMYQLALEFDTTYTQQKYKKAAFVLLRKAANLGYKPAQFAYAEALQGGKGTKKNELEAEKWFLIAKDSELKNEQLERIQKYQDEIKKKEEEKYFEKMRIKEKQKALEEDKKKAEMKCIEENDTDCLSTASK
ncbi:MAG: sel1 repeat family protein [Clostridia bacterium]|nr:sel1 repeat family protein [Clostridia bacterium]